VITLISKSVLGRPISRCDVDCRRRLSTAPIWIEAHARRDPPEPSRVVQSEQNRALLRDVAMVVVIPFVRIFGAVADATRGGYQEHQEQCRVVNVPRCNFFAQRASIRINSAPWLRMGQHVLSWGVLELPRPLSLSRILSSCTGSWRRTAVWHGESSKTMRLIIFARTHITRLER
jgi:hypothetical protein